VHSVAKVSLYFLNLHKILRFFRYTSTPYCEKNIFDPYEVWRMTFTNHDSAEEAGGPKNLPKLWHGKNQTYTRFFVENAKKVKNRLTPFFWGGGEGGGGITL
jgi:hypothetical protein